MIALNRIGGWLAAAALLLLQAACGGGAGDPRTDLASALKAGTPVPQTGIWWNPSASGSGYAVELQGSLVTLGAYMYEPDGHAVWYVGPLSQQGDGSYRGTVTRYAGGQSLTGSYRAPGSAVHQATVTFTLSSATQGTLSFVTSAGASVVGIQRLAINGGSVAASSAPFESGLWWNEAESGRGFFIDVQGSTAALASYMYTDSGRPVWYLTVGAVGNAPGAISNGAFSGALEAYQGGQQMGAAYRAPQSAGQQGTVVFRALTGTTGLMTFPGGRVMRVQRLRFASSEPPPVLHKTSYANYKEIGLVPQQLPVQENTRAYGNFMGLGRLDLFRARLTYDLAKPLAQATPAVLEFFGRQPDGSYSFVTGTMVQYESPACISPRKSLVADFNGDGRPDVFMPCTGYDAPPFPGERNTVLLSQSDGRYRARDASQDVGFFHGAAAADLNGDGHIDVVLVDNMDPDRALVLLNDGSGRFTREAAGRLPVSLRGGNYFTVELVDVNQDGSPDLLFGGHEWEGAPTRVFLNPGNNNFSQATAWDVPAVAGQGVVLDFTVTGSGATRTLWVLRTSGGGSTYYSGTVVQKVAIPSMASSVVLTKSGSWTPWLIPATVGGVPVITSDNAAESISIPQ